MIELLVVSMKTLEHFVLSGLHETHEQVYKIQKDLDLGRYPILTDRRQLSDLFLITISY